MKVAIFGGYGVFGSRLAELLVRDGHHVIIIGRNGQAAEALAAKIGGASLELDRAGDLSPLWAMAPNAVVDAAGPFHAYGGDPYRLAKAAIAQGIHYLDLADDGRSVIYTYETTGERTGIVTLLSDLQKAGLNMADMKTQQSSLEDIFVGLVKETA